MIGRLAQRHIGYSNLGDGPPINGKIRREHNESAQPPINGHANGPRRLRLQSKAAVGQRPVTSPVPRIAEVTAVVAVFS